MRTSEKPTPMKCPTSTCCAGDFPANLFSIAGHRGGFADPRGTLFFEIARLTAAKRPAYLLLENVPGLLNHDGGRTFAAILHTLDGLGYGVEWQVLNSKDFGVPQSRKRVYLVGYLDEKCRGKILPFTETAGTPLKQIRPGAQGERIYSPEGVSCTLTAQAGGFGENRAVLHRRPHQGKHEKGYKMAYPGDSVDLAYPTLNTRRGRVGRKIAHTITTGSSQGTLCCVDLNEEPALTDMPAASPPSRTAGSAAISGKPPACGTDAASAASRHGNACGSRAGRMNASTLSCRSNPTPSFTSRPETASPSMWWRPSESGWPPPIGEVNAVD